MKLILLCFSTLLLLKNVSSLLKVLDDSNANCAGLICDYSFITWKEKIEILQANNELRNTIADGYTADITTAAINKLAWSEKLGTLAQDQANQCPESKIWTSTEIENGRCEYASAKRVRKYLRLHKNFSSFVDENRMMDLEDLTDKTKIKLRRASAYSVGCGYVLRYYKDKLIDHFVCLYCYVNNKRDYISFNGNRSCQQDCLHENFTCDRIYNRLCSYRDKDGNIDSRHKSNLLCPKVNLLTGSVLLWNFLGNNVICMLAAIFISTSVIFSIVLAVYFSIKNYDRWKKYLVGKAIEQELPSESTTRPETPTPSQAPTGILQAPIVPQAPTDIPQAPTLPQAPSDIFQAPTVPHADIPQIPSTPPEDLMATSFSDKVYLPLQCLPPVPQSIAQKLPESEKNLAKCSPNEIKSKSATGTATSGHKVNKTLATTRARKIAAKGASETVRVGRGNGKNRISDPIYGQRDNRATNVQPACKNSNRGRRVCKMKNQGGSIKSS